MARKKTQPKPAGKPEPTYTEGPMAGLTGAQAAEIIGVLAEQGIRPSLDDDAVTERWAEAVVALRAEREPS